MGERTQATSSRRVLTGAALRREFHQSRLNRRHLLRRGLALGLAPPALSGFHRDLAAAPRHQLGLKGGDGTLIVAIAGEPVSFNPNLPIDQNALLPAVSIFSMLVTLDADYNILPELAERWTISDDGLIYTFELVRDATWHDDEQVTAADVKYTFDQILAMDTALAHGRLAPIAAIETPNDRTVVLTLSAPSASLLGMLGDEGTYILPAHRYEGTDWATNEANWSPVGSGPFRFLSYTPGASVDLETYFDYFGLGPFVDRLLFQIIPEPESAVAALLNGEIDVIAPSLPAAQIEALAETPGFAVGEQALPTIVFLGFNLRREPTANQAVRLALSRAIDRQQLVTTALAGLGTPATTFVPMVIDWAANPGEDEDAAAPIFDPAMAASELDDAGYPAVDGARFVLDLAYLTTRPDHEPIATMIREQLRAVNVETDLLGLDNDAWRERLTAGDFDLSLVSASLGPDPVTLRDQVGTSGDGNYWSYSNPAIDALFAEGETLSDQEARAAVYDEVQRLLAAELPLLPLVSPIAVYPHTERASGFFFGDARGDVGRDMFTLVQLDEP